METRKIDRRARTVWIIAVTAALFGLAVLGRPAPADAAEPAATKLSVAAEPGTVVHGGSATLRATLTRSSDGAAISGQLLRFDARPVGGTTWTSAGRVTTDDRGRARVSVTPTAHTEYRARFVGTDRWAASRSATRTVSVAMRVTADLASNPIFLGRSTSLSGKVTPPHAGRDVTLQRSSPDGWIRIDRQKLTSASSYRFTIRPSKAGTTTYRVVVAADADHARGVSPRRELRTRGFTFPIRPASAASYPRDHHDYPATDIFAACGTTTVSPTAGTIHEVSRVDRWDPKVNAGPTRGGLSVSIIGRDGARYYLSHFETIERGVEAGVRIAAGQKLGTVGRTGSARNTPCHIHLGISPNCGVVGDWEVRRGVVWPYPYLDAWKAGKDSSARKAVDAWAAANPKRCPA